MMPPGLHSSIASGSRRGIGVALLSSEALVNRRTLGILASVVASGFGAWWLVTQRRSRVSSSTTAAEDRGDIIFRNTPVPSESEALI
jgi:hypothetical protein